MRSKKDVNHGRLLRDIVCMCGGGKIHLHITLCYATHRIELTFDANTATREPESVGEREQPETGEKKKKNERMAV